MKKSVWILFLFSLISAFFIGCDSFVAGSDLKKEIEDLVDYSKASTYHVRVQADEGTGTIINGAGDNEIKVSDSISIGFQKSKDYKFTNWIAVSKDDASVTMEDYVSFKNRTELETTVTLIKEPPSEIIIKPSCDKLPTTDINISTSFGRVSPTGTLKDIKVSETTDLILSIDETIQFIGWQVYDLKTGSVITDDNYITFEDLQSTSTSFTLDKVPDSKDIILSIQPLCEVRPQILAATPEFSVEGVYRDSNIQVIFDHKMSNSSIYYTDQEISELKEKGYELLEPLTDEDGTENYYGYKSNNLVYFKNISITDSLTQESVLNYFDAPYFDELSYLIIPAKSGSEAPKAGLILNVELSKNLHYTSKETEIQLASDKQWKYKVTALQTL